MRTLVIGDIHGGLKALQQVLDRLVLTKNDKLIFLGDYVDGWSESAQLINYLIELDKKYTCIFIRGNHDSWCEDWLRTNHTPELWLFHGGQCTVDSYQKYNQQTKKAHLNFFERMVDYHIDSKNRLFIHAGFSSMHGVKAEVYRTNYFWDRTLWEMCFALKDTNLIPDSVNYPVRIKPYYEIYIGHTPTTKFNETEPINALNLWNIDTGAAFKGSLTILDVHTKEFWQSDPVYTLYPHERGRN